ncbi:MAG: methionyl-tRNA formyltransferase [Anaerolineales bacterium]
MNIVFMGSPEFALPTLQALADHFTLVGVVTQPDRPAGRGRKLAPPPVKTLALELGLPVIQPRRLKEPEAMAQLAAWQPDVIVVAAFGQILRKDVLDLPPHGCLNVHASLLPRWRGAAPIHAAILHGDSQTGVTIMQMDPGLDTGPILSQRATPISAHDTAGSLSERLSRMGADLLIETIPSYLSGALRPQAQDDALATYAPKLEKTAGEMDFTQPLDALERQVRAMHPWPGAYLLWEGNRLMVHRATPKGIPHPLPQGTRLIHEGQPAVAAADGLLLLEEVQPAGKRPMSGHDFLNGARGWESVSSS